MIGNLTSVKILADQARIDQEDMEEQCDFRFCHETSGRILTYYGWKYDVGAVAGRLYSREEREGLHPLQSPRDEGLSREPDSLPR